MTTEVIKTTFMFRRGLQSAWEKNNPVLAYGEPGFEKDTYRLKIGDGITPWNNLDYFTGGYEAILYGYYLNDKFYTDSTYITELEKDIHKFYIDKNSDIVYHYDGTKFVSVNDTIPTASDLIAGISKLYQDGGLNTDGSMSQKAVTDGVQSIHLDVDKDDVECLVLDLPWGKSQG